MPQAPHDPTDEVRRATTNGMLAMMAMMLICCVTVFFAVALIPLLGWPLGLALAALVIAAVMFAHLKLMSHGGH